MSDLSYLVAKQRQDMFDYYKNQEELKTRRRIKEELEKIKAEIKEYYWLLDTYGNVITQNNIEAVIEEHLSELKGEQNES